MFVVVQETQYPHPVSASKSRSTCRLYNVVLSELAAALWQMHLDEQAARVAFFVLLRETFLLHSANLANSDETVGNKKGTLFQKLHVKVSN